MAGQPAKKYKSPGRLYFVFFKYPSKNDVIVSHSNVKFLTDIYF